MRILSIDLPWGEKPNRHVGFAWYDEAFPQAIEVRSYATGGPDPFAGAPTDIGTFDLILIDQPLGDLDDRPEQPSSFRRVEKTWTNKVRKQWANGEMVQWPRFQAGKNAQDAGLKRAEMARQLFGHASTVVVESFPQLVVPYLMTQPRAAAANAVVKLASHKKGPESAVAREQLAELVSSSAGCQLQPPTSSWAKSGAADAMDAVLGLLPGIDWSRGGERVVLLHGEAAGTEADPLTTRGASSPGPWPPVGPATWTRGILAMRWWD